ncbi:MAG: hypothetical protein A2X61_02370 [Ignavibacteria bacterium GWB2_35_12]|nr:MAG: hypothetical protein A2X63_03545 [Ignavibacteria bacterium GWA2_35_8]OGU42427.1 MAG: hypothetical protein A2X61_02370 [Ignavibacteria bacterium GWB2_35_12]OGU96596.1 MAG: hypothetical protein A2220_11955 [Ignavibacteria bacterium RIFOXYA2_FULL_35_10]OGV24207.1 MAG: hypothetical protein A2475_08300 [Ignavibacteria bacterium RIFOXYC2_FULL_35_21]
MKTILSFVILILTLLSSCDEQTSEVKEDDEPGYYFTLTDSKTGAPVNNVTISIYYLITELPTKDTSIKSINAPNPFREFTHLWISKNETEQTEITIIDEQTNNVIDTVINEILEAGFHEFDWFPDYSSSQNIKEGFYNVRIKTPDTVMNYEIMYFKNNYFYDMIYKPLPSKVIKNPIDGKFILKKEDMPYTGKKFNRVHESGVNLGKFLLKEEVYMEILSDDYNPVILALNLSVDKRADYSVKMIKK